MVLRRLFKTAVRGGIVFITTIAAANAVQASSFVNTSSGQLGTIDTSSGTFTVEANGLTLTDIALTEANELFGITFTDLYKIDTVTNTFSLIGNHGAVLNGLGFDGSGNLYGTGGNSFYKIDTSTGQASFVGNLGSFASAGDIVFNPDTNEFLGTSVRPSNSTLFSIALDGTTTQIGSIGFSNVYGLFFEDGDLFGYTANREQILIDLATGAGVIDKNVTGLAGQIYGAASLPSSGPTKVPEPASMLGLLAVSAMAGASWLKRKRQKKA